MSLSGQFKTIFLRVEKPKQVLWKGQDSAIRKFYSRMKNPGSLTLEEFWQLCDMMDVPPEVRLKIVN